MVYRPAPDPISVLEHAKTFSVASGVLPQFEQQAHALGQGVQFGGVVPVVLSATSCELYLKALYVATYRDRWPGSVLHDERKLFSLLDEEARTAIWQSWAEAQRVSRPWVTGAFRALGEEFPHRPLTMNGFLEELDALSDLFSWRYAFDGARKPVNAGGAFDVSTLELVENLVRERSVLAGPLKRKPKAPKWSKGKQPSTVPDPLIMLAHSEYFERAAQALASLAATPGAKRYESVSIALAAYSYELLLKALFVASAKRRWLPKVGHDLMAIYRELERRIQDEIGFGWVASQIQRGHVSTSESDYLPELERSATAWQDWRYLFEAQDPDFGDILGTVPWIKVVIRSLVASGGKLTYMEEFARRTGANGQGRP